MHKVSKLTISYGAFHLIRLHVKCNILIDLCVTWYTNPFDSCFINTLRPFLMLRRGMTDRFGLGKSAECFWFQNLSFNWGKNLQELGDQNLLEKSREVCLHNFLNSKLMHYRAPVSQYLFFYGELLHLVYFSTI